MGTVYLALHLGPAGIAKIVAIKQLRADFATADSAREMFLNEARIAMRLNHPNIVQTIEVVEDDDLYLVMEFLDGQPLSRLLKSVNAGAFPLGTKLRVLIKALEGLHYVHELTDYDGKPLGAIHRDVSPQNILVTYSGHVKLVDFGVAKIASTSNLTASGVFKGKTRYASPEQALCKPADRRADIFSVGTILWEVLAGKRMWHGASDAAILYALASGRIPPLLETRSDVPPALEAICTRSLAIDPAERYATALDFRNALAGYLHSARPQEADLAAAVSMSFSDERTGLHTLIDSQTRATREATTGSITARPPSQRRNPPPLSEPASSLTRGALAVEPTLSSDTIPRPPRRRTTLAAIGGAAVGVVAVIALMMGSRSEPDPASRPGAADPGVHLSLKASPPNARFLLDGNVLKGNPYEADMARSDALHHLSIRADGYVARELDVPFNRDLDLSETLAAVPPPVRTASPPSSPGPSYPRGGGYANSGAASRPASEVTTRPARAAPTRSIDEDDPYH